MKQVDVNLFFMDLEDRVRDGLKILQAGEMTGILNEKADVLALQISGAVMNYIKQKIPLEHQAPIPKYTDTLELRRK